MSGSRALFLLDIVGAHRALFKKPRPMDNPNKKDRVSSGVNIFFVSSEVTF